MHVHTPTPMQCAHMHTHVHTQTHVVTVALPGPAPPCLELLSVELALGVSFLLPGTGQPAGFGGEVRAAGPERAGCPEPPHRGLQGARSGGRGPGLCCVPEIWSPPTGLPILHPAFPGLVQPQGEGSKEHQAGPRPAPAVPGGPSGGATPMPQGHGLTRAGPGRGVSQGTRRETQQLCWWRFKHSLCGALTCRGRTGRGLKER